MLKIELVKFTELLFYAKNELKMDWNRAHEVLINDRVAPEYEIKSKDYDFDELDYFGWSDRTIAIMKGFMKHNKINSMTLIDD